MRRFNTRWDMQIFLDEDDSINQRGWEEWSNTLTYISPKLSISCGNHAVYWHGSADVMLMHLWKNQVCVPPCLTTHILFYFLHTCMHTRFPQPPCRLPLSRKNVLLDEGTALRLTNVCVCVHVSDWPCLGRPTQHHNSHDWVFSHCASQQTTAAHTAASADRVTVILNWLDRDVMSFIFVLHLYI